MRVVFRLTDSNVNVYHLCLYIKLYPTEMRDSFTSKKILKIT